MEQTETNGINEPAVYMPPPQSDEPALAVEIAGEIDRMHEMAKEAPVSKAQAFEVAIAFLFRARALARSGKKDAEAAAKRMRDSAYRALLGGGE